MPVRDRSGRDQSSRDQIGRDQSGKDQSGRDRTGQDQGWDKSGHIRARASAIWGEAMSADIRDHSCADVEHSEDNPFARYLTTWNLRRSRAGVQCRLWSPRATPSAPQPCRLCKDRKLVCREDWENHVTSMPGPSTKEQESRWMPKESFKEQEDDNKDKDKSKFNIISP